MNAFQMTNTVGVDKSSHRRRLASSDGRMKNRRYVRERKRPSERPCNRIDRAFRCIVNHRGRRSQRAGKRTDVDDAPAIGVEMLERFLSGEKHPENICVEKSVKLSLGDFFKRHKFVNAGVVDENVDLAEGFLRFSE